MQATQTTRKGLRGTNRRARRNCKEKQLPICCWLQGHVLQVKAQLINLPQQPSRQSSENSQTAISGPSMLAQHLHMPWSACHRLRYLPTWGVCNCCKTRSLQKDNSTPFECRYDSHSPSFDILRPRPPPQKKGILSMEPQTACNASKEITQLDQAHIQRSHIKPPAQAAKPKENTKPFLRKLLTQTLSHRSSRFFGTQQARSILVLEMLQLRNPWPQ